MVECNGTVRNDRMRSRQGKGESKRGTQLESGPCFGVQLLDFHSFGVYIEVFGVLCFRLVWLLVLGACLASSSSGPFAI